MAAWEGDDETCQQCRRFYDQNMRSPMLLECTHTMCLACTRFSSHCPHCDRPVAVVEVSHEEEAVVEEHAIVAVEEEEVEEEEGEAPDPMAKQREVAAPTLTLEDLKNARLPDNNVDWECPICTALYDNDGRVPMMVDACYDRAPNMYTDLAEDEARRKIVKGCGHVLCEPCSVQRIARRRDENTCPTCRGWIKSFAPDLTRLHDIVSEDSGRYVLHVRQNNTLNASMDPLALKAAEIPRLRQALKDKDAQVQAVEDQRLEALASIKKARDEAKTFQDAFAKAERQRLKAVRDLTKYTGLVGKLAEQEQMTRSLFEDVICSRIKRVAAGFLPASQLGITVSRVPVWIMEGTEAGPPVKYIVTTSDGKRMEYVRPNFNVYRTQEEHRYSVIERMLDQAKKETQLPSPQELKDSFKTAGDSILVRTGTWLHHFLSENMMAEALLDDTCGADINTHYVMATPSMLAAAEKRRDEEEKALADKAAKKAEEEAAKKVEEEAERKKRAEEEATKPPATSHVNADYPLRCISCLRDVDELCNDCGHAWCDDSASFCQHGCSGVFRMLDYQNVRGDNDVGTLLMALDMFKGNWYQQACEARLRWEMTHLDGDQGTLPFGRCMRKLVVDMFKKEGALPQDDKEYDSIEAVRAALVVPGPAHLYRNVWRFLWYFMLDRDGVPLLGPGAGKKGARFGKGESSAWPKIDIPGRFHNSLERDYREGVDEPRGASSSSGSLFATPEEALAAGRSLGRHERPSEDFVPTEAGRATFLGALGEMAAAVRDDWIVRDDAGPTQMRALLDELERDGGRPAVHVEEDTPPVPSPAQPAVDLSSFRTGLPRMQEEARWTRQVGNARRIIGRALEPTRPSDNLTLIEMNPGGFGMIHARSLRGDDDPVMPQPVHESPPDNSNRAPIRMRGFGSAGFRVAPDASAMPNYAGRDYHTHPAFANEEDPVQTAADAARARETQRLLAAARALDTDAAEAFFDGPLTPPPPLVEGVNMFSLTGNPIVRAPDRTPEEREALAQQADQEETTRLEAVARIRGPMYVHHSTTAVSPAPGITDSRPTDEENDAQRTFRRQLEFIGVAPRQLLLTDHHTFAPRPAPLRQPSRAVTISHEEPEDFFDELPPLEEDDDGDDVMEDVE